MLAASFVVTVADLRTISTPVTFRTSIRAHRTHPSRRAITLASRGTAGTTVLALALRFALVAVFSGRTQIIAQRPRVTRSTVALARNMMATSTVSTAALLAAVLAISIRSTLLVAVVAGPTSGAHALSVERIAGGSVLAHAIPFAILAPFSYRALEIAQRAAVSRFAFANVGRDTRAVKTVLRTDWNATIAVVRRRVTLATLFHRSLLYQLLFPVDRLVNHFVFRASRRETEAPGVLSYRVRLLLRYSYSYLVCVLPRAYIRPFERTCRPKNGNRDQQPDCKGHSGGSLIQQRRY